MFGNVIWFFFFFLALPTWTRPLKKLPKGLMSDLPSDCSLMVGDFIENTPQYFQHRAPRWELDPPLLQLVWQKFVVLFLTPLLLNVFIFFSWEHSLTFKLIERATDARMSSLEYNDQWLHHLVGTNVKAGNVLNLHLWKVVQCWMYYARELKWKKW